MIQLNCFYNLKWKHHFGAISADHQLKRSIFTLNAAISSAYSAQQINGIESTASDAAIKSHSSKNQPASPYKNPTNNPYDVKTASKTINLHQIKSKNIRR